MAFGSQSQQRRCGLCCLVIVVAVNPSKGGVAFVSILVKEAWSLDVSLSYKEAWPLCVCISEGAVASVCQ